MVVVAVIMAAALIAITFEVAVVAVVVIGMPVVAGFVGTAVAVAGTTGGAFVCGV